MEPPLELPLCPPPEALDALLEPPVPLLSLLELQPHPTSALASATI